MHSPYLFGIAVAFIVLAVTSILPPAVLALLGPAGPFLVQILAPVKAVAEGFAKPVALGFIAATAMFSAASLALEGWLEGRLGIEVPVGTVRWLLTLPKIGAWAVVLALCTGGATFAVATLRGRAAGASLPAWAVFAGAYLILWYCW